MIRKQIWKKCEKGENMMSGTRALREPSSNNCRLFECAVEYFMKILLIPLLLLSYYSCAQSWLNYGTFKTVVL